MSKKVSLRKKIKNKLKNSLMGIHFLHFLRLMREKMALRLNDYEFLQKIYKKNFEREFNLKTPTYYTEKLNWLKLFYHIEEIERCSDKYTVRGYLEEKGYGEYLNKLLGVYDSPKDINFDALPDKFVIKVSHGSSWNIICTDKSKLNLKKVKAQLKCWQKEDISVFGREWNYRNSPRKIIIEEFIEAPALNDYKFICFNGEVIFIQINHDVEGKHFVDYYDKEWNKLPIGIKGYNNSSVQGLKTPKKFNEMYKIAEDIAKSFPCVRVDFYNPDDRIILGEITFFTGGGLQPFFPLDNPYDKMFGDKLQLPEPNYNLELYNKLQND